MIAGIDRQNLIRMVLAGRLTDLRVYAKSLIKVEEARRRVDASGRGGIRFIMPPINLVKPDPEIVLLEQPAIDAARKIMGWVDRANDPLEFTEMKAARIDAFVDLAMTWFKDHIPSAEPEPDATPGAVCAPLSSHYDLSAPGAGETP